MNLSQPVTLHPLHPPPPPDSTSFSHVHFNHFISTATKVLTYSSINSKSKISSHYHLPQVQVIPPEAKILPPCEPVEANKLSAIRVVQWGRHWRDIAFQRGEVERRKKAQVSSKSERRANSIRFFFIKLYLTYYTMLVSAVPHSDSIFLYIMK